MTNNHWPRVPLGDVISHRKDFIRISDTEKYMRCRVQLNARGIVLRDRVLGVDIKTKTQQVCKAGELLVAEIDAKHGGFGIVPDHLNGAIVSSHYFLYEIDTARLRRQFLDYYIRTPGFQEQVAARGSTNYAAIRPHHVLEYEMPLPSPDEQDQVVATLDEVAAKLDEARQVRSEIEQEAKAMLRSAFARIIDGAPRKSIGDVAPLERRPVEIAVEGEYPELGVRSFGRGVFHKPTLLGADLTWQKLFRVCEGDIVISNIKAWEGALAVAGPDEDGRVGSHRYLTLAPVEGKTTPHFLCFYLLTDEGLADIGHASPGSADRNRTLGQKALQQIKVPIPAYEKQLWFDRLQAKVREMLAAQQDSETELEALLPAVLDKAFRGELSQPSVAPAVKRPAATSQTPPFARYVLLLLEAWGQPVSRMALEAGLMFMLNDHIRTRLLKPEAAETSLASKSGSRNLFTGLDELIEILRANKVIRKDVLALEPEQAQKLSKLSQADRRRAAEAVKAVEALGESRAREVIVSEVPDGELVTVS